MARTLNYFISHSWSYSGHYDTLSQWIKNESLSNFYGIKFLDLSVPKDDPIHNAKNAELEAQIRLKIYYSHIVIIPTGMYASHSNWIGKEIRASILLSKPILAVNPWGQQRTSSRVSDYADKTVGWNKQSVIAGIYELALS